MSGIRLRGERECSPILVLDDMEYLQISILLPTLSSTSTYRDVLLSMIDFVGYWSRLCNKADKAIINELD